MYKLFLKKHAVRPRSRNVSSNIVRWICDLRAWLEDIPFTGNVSLYDHTQFFSNGHRTSPPPPAPSVEVAETEEMLTFRVACGAFRWDGLSR